MINFVEGVICNFPFLKKKRCSAIVISYFYYYLRIQRPSRILTHQDLPLHAPVSIFLLFYPSLIQDLVRGTS